MAVKSTTKKTARKAAPAKAKPSTKAASRATAKSVASAPAKASASRSTHVLKRQFKGDLMLGTLFAEMFGTFILAAAVLVTRGDPLVTAITVLVLVLAAGRLSGAHLNPAVTLALLTARQLPPLRALFYLLAQFFGAMLGLVVITQFVTTGETSALTGQAEAFKLPALVGDWRPLFAEAFGALLFGFGIGAAVIGAKKGLTAAFTISMALLIGLVLASQASHAALNPAVALGLNGYATDNMWTYWVYGLAPVVGVTAGVWLYKLLEWDVFGDGKNVVE